MASVPRCRLACVLAYLLVCTWQVAAGSSGEGTPTGAQQQRGGARLPHATTPSESSGAAQRRLSGVTVSAQTQAAAPAAARAALAVAPSAVPDYIKQRFAAEGFTYLGRLRLSPRLPKDNRQQQQRKRQAAMLRLESARVPALQQVKVYRMAPPGDMYLATYMYRPSTKLQTAPSKVLFPPEGYCRNLTSNIQPDSQAVPKPGTNSSKTNSSSNAAATNNRGSSGSSNNKRSSSSSSSSSSPPVASSIRQPAAGSTTNTNQKPGGSSTANKPGGSSSNNSSKAGSTGSSNKALGNSSTSNKAGVSSSSGSSNNKANRNSSTNSKAGASSSNSNKAGGNSTASRKVGSSNSNKPGGSSGNNSSKAGSSGSSKGNSSSSSTNKAGGSSNSQKQPGSGSSNNKAGSNSSNSNKSGSSSSNTSKAGSSSSGSNKANSSNSRSSKANDSNSSNNKAGSSSKSSSTTTTNTKAGGSSSSSPSVAKPATNSLQRVVALESAAVPAPGAPSAADTAPEPSSIMQVATDSSSSSPGPGPLTLPFLLAGRGFSLVDPSNLAGPLLVQPQQMQLPFLSCISNAILQPRPLPPVNPTPAAPRAGPAPAPGPAAGPAPVAGPAAYPPSPSVPPGPAPKPSPATSPGVAAGPGQRPPPPGGPGPSNQVTKPSPVAPPPAGTSSSLPANSSSSSSGSRPPAPNSSSSSSSSSLPTPGSSSSGSGNNAAACPAGTVWTRWPAPLVDNSPCNRPLDDSFNNHRRQLRSSSSGLPPTAVAAAAAAGGVGGGSLGWALVEVAEGDEQQVDGLDAAAGSVASGAVGPGPASRQEQHQQEEEWEEVDTNPAEQLSVSAPQQAAAHVHQQLPLLALQKDGEGVQAVKDDAIDQQGQDEDEEQEEDEEEGGSKDGSMQGRLQEDSGAAAAAAEGWQELPAWQRQLQAIIGQDDRQPCPASWPYGAVGQLDFNLSGQAEICTATLIGPDKVVTAAHCVWDFSASTFVQGVAFAPGRYQEGCKVVSPHGVLRWKFVTIFEVFSDSYVPDIAVITLEVPIGYKLGWLGLKAVCAGGGTGSTATAGASRNASGNATLELTTAGYPRGLVTGRCLQSSCQVPIRDCTSDTMDHTCDTEAGQSGSSMWDASHFVRMIHTSGDLFASSGKLSNLGAPLTQFIFDNIATW